MTDSIAFGGYGTRLGLIALLLALAWLGARNHVAWGLQESELSWIARGEMIHFELHECRREDVPDGRGRLRERLCCHGGTAGGRYGGTIPLSPIEVLE